VSLSQAIEELTARVDALSTELTARKPELHSDSTPEPSSNGNGKGTLHILRHVG
jgi:hypothetical protein